jgi:hypothetical protein
MKKSILLSSVFLFVIFNWSFNPTTKQARATASLSLVSPSDSSKVTTSEPIFEWNVTVSSTSKEKIKRFHIRVAEDPGFNSIIWQDSNIAPSTPYKKSYPDTATSLVRWHEYFWSVRVLVDSIIKVTGTDTTKVTTWYKCAKPFTFFYATAKLIEIPDSLPTIQKGISFAAKGDTILVKSGIYYENLRFNKKGVILASHFARNGKIATIDSTIIDGDRLTRGKDEGSVIYFTSDADSNSKVIGFTIRNGKGTKFKEGSVEKVKGGGIFCELGSTPTIAYNVITHNWATDDGGGIFIDMAAPNILNNIITQNSAGGSGGAIECFYSIRTKPSASPSLSGGEGEGEEGTETMPKPSSSSSEETEKISPPSESSSKTGEDDLNNSLYPRDATEVFSGPSLDPLAKLTQNQPPVLDSIGPKTVMEGDTLEFRLHATDVDLDSIILDTLNVPLNAVFVDSGNGAGSFTFTPDFTQADTYYVTFIASDGSLADSEVVEIVVTEAGNHAPELDSIGPKRVLEKNTLKFRVHATDVDEDSIILDALDVPLNAVFVDSGNGAGSFTFTPNYTQADTYYVTFIATDTMSSADSEVVEIVVKVNEAPVAMCFDSLAGFTVNDSLLLDASKSFDPNSGMGDSVKYFIWKGISFTNCKVTSPLTITVDSLKKVRKFPANKGGGIYKISLYVRDTFGLKSKNTDTLLISVQLRPTVNAGPDTIVRRDTWAYLHGSACEVNWDQTNSLKYEWFQDLSGNPTPVTLFDLSGIPNTQVQNVKFKAPPDSNRCGVFLFTLRATDPFETSWPDDTIRVIVNALPQIDSITPDTSKVKFSEGDTVALEVFAHNPDNRTFGDSLTFNWTAVSWPESADKPKIIDSTKSVAKFIALKHGKYKLQVVVHDTISRKQYPPVLNGFNIDTATVLVDTTFAYPIIMGNLISSNTAGLKGGGIDCQNSSPDIINNIFYKNESSSSGGGVCCRSSSTPLIKRSIFFGNVSGDSTGGAIADLKAELSPSASIGFKEKLVITTNDFWNNVGRELYHPPADTSNNIYQFPRLIDPEYGDFRLECTSPCRKDSIGLLRWLYPDSCSPVPALSMISLSLFQNPVATAAAHFLVNTNVSLKTPPVAYVTIGGGSPAPVYFTSISSTTYRGNFVFTASGTVHISVFATSIQEVTDTLNKDFSVQLIGAGKIGKLVSHDNRLEVLFLQDASRGEIYATSLPVSDDPQYNFEDEDKVALGEAYHLGPPSDFKKELTISFPLDGYDLTDKDKSLFSIYRYDENGWEREASFLDENSICAKVTKLGVYRLIYDAKQEHITGIPKTYQLLQNYPNPFNPETMIKYDLPDPGYVNITVFNILGQKVKTLIDEYQEAGHKSVNWDGKDDGGKEVASGIYFYKIKATGFEKTKKMVLLK